MTGHPPSSPPESPPWAPRRSAGGARKELTERVVVRAPGFETSGWTLNVSRGGIRAVVEERLGPDVEYELLLGDATSARKVRVAWSQEERDGQIVGLKYLDIEASMPPADASTPPGER